MISGRWWGLRQYQIDDGRLSLCLRLFYGVLVLSVVFLLRGQPWGNPDWLWPVFWVRWIPDYPLAKIILFVLCLAALVGSIRKPFSVPIKALAFFSFFQLMAAHFSFGKIGHFMHAPLLAAFWLTWIREPGVQRGEVGPLYNRLFFWAAQVSFLGPYSLSGLWKLRMSQRALAGGEWGGSDPLTIGFAYNKISNGMRATSFWDGSTLPHGLLMSLWVAGVLFELSSFAVAWLPGLQRFWGVALVAFHLATLLAMGIDFYPAMAGAIVLFVFHPYRLRKTFTCLARERSRASAA